MVLVWLWVSKLLIICNYNIILYNISWYINRCLFFGELSYKSDKGWVDVRIAIEKHRRVMKFWKLEVAPRNLTAETFDQKNHLLVVQLQGASFEEDISEGTYRKNCFTVHEVGSPHSITLSAKNMHQKQRWIQLMRTPLDVEKDPSNGLLVPRALFILKGLLMRLNGLQTEFIFRVAGTDDATERIEKVLSHNSIPILEQKDVHAVSSVIKKWFKQKPDRLLSTFSIQQIVEFQKKKIILSDFLQKMDEPNKSIFLWLIDLSAQVVRAQVSEYTEASKIMNNKSMSILFAPIVFDVPMNDPVEGAKNTNYVSLLLENFIDNRLRQTDPN